MYSSIFIHISVCKKWKSAADIYLHMLSTLSYPDTADIPDIFPSLYTNCCNEETKAEGPFEISKKDISEILIGAASHIKTFQSGDFEDNDYIPGIKNLEFRTENS